VEYLLNLFKFLILILIGTGLG